MYVNGMGFRAIERIKGVHHTSIINWVKQVRELLPDAYEPDRIPLVGELDELGTFVGKKNKLWRATAVNHFQSGILGSVLGGHSAITFRPLWEARWQLEMLLLYHRWMATLPHVYPRWRRVHLSFANL
jgi:hypothetical protein